MGDAGLPVGPFLFFFPTTAAAQTSLQATLALPRRSLLRLGYVIRSKRERVAIPVARMDGEIVVEHLLRDCVRVRDSGTVRIRYCRNPVAVELPSILSSVIILSVVW